MDRRIRVIGPCEIDKMPVEEGDNDIYISSLLEGEEFTVNIRSGEPFVYASKEYKRHWVTIPREDYKRKYHSLINHLKEMNKKEMNKAVEVDPTVVSKEAAELSSILEERTKP